MGSVSVGGGGRAAAAAVDAEIGLRGDREAGKRKRDGRVRVCMCRLVCVGGGDVLVVARAMGEDPAEGEERRGRALGGGEKEVEKRGLGRVAVAGGGGEVGAACCVG